jgi:hypothetical protein
MSEIAILLINDFCDCGDEVIKIRKCASDKYYLSYKGKNIDQFTYISQNEVMRYIEDLLILTQADDDPFLSIQFNLPCFPSVIIKVKDLTCYTVKRTIIDRIESIIKAWPIQKVDLLPQ